jgi:hypothetical protein
MGRTQRASAITIIKQSGSADHSNPVAVYSLVLRHDRSLYDAIDGDGNDEHNPADNE